MADIITRSNLNRGEQPVSGDPGLAGTASDTVLRRRNIEGPALDTMIVNNEIRDMINNQAAPGGTTNAEAIKNLSEEQRKKIEEEEAKKEAKREQEIARRLIQVVRSDHISDVDLATMQSKHLVS